VKTNPRIMELGEVFYEIYLGSQGVAPGDPCVPVWSELADFKRKAMNDGANAVVNHWKMIHSK
jgi:hypothetical protein